MVSTLPCLICKQRVISRRRRSIPLFICRISRLFPRCHSIRPDQSGGSKDNDRLWQAQRYRDCFRGFNYWDAICVDCHIFQYANQLFPWREFPFWLHSSIYFYSFSHFHIYSFGVIFFETAGLVLASSLGRTILDLRDRGNKPVLRVWIHGPNPDGFLLGVFIGKLVSLYDFFSEHWFESPVNSKQRSG